MAFIKNVTKFKRTNLIVKQPYKHQEYSVSSKGHTIFRLFPAPNPDGGFDEQIVPVDGDPIEGLGNSFAILEVVSWLGKDKLSIVTTCSDVDGEEYKSPALLFYNKIQDFVKDATKRAIAGQVFSKALPMWSPWFASKGIASLPQSRMLLQGVLIETAGKPCTDKNGNIVNKVPVVLCLGRSATINMEDKLTTKVNAQDDISAANSKMGDITGLTTGANIKADSYMTAEKQTRYKIESMQTPVPLSETMVQAHFVPWEDLLNIQTAEWQIKKLVEQFSPESVDYALGGDSLYGPMLGADVAGSYERMFGDTEIVNIEDAAVQETAATEPVLLAGTTPVATAVLEAVSTEEDEVPSDLVEAAAPTTKTKIEQDVSSAMAIAMEAAKASQTK